MAWGIDWLGALRPERKDSISTGKPRGDSPNTFEREKPETPGQTRAEAGIESERQKGGVFVNAVRATRMPMVLTDPNLAGNPIVFANEAFLKLTGYSMEEVLGQQPHFMDGPQTDPKDAARFHEVIRSDQDDIIETVQYRRNGSRFVATVLISGFKDESGHVLNHFMSWLDVTRRVEAEDEVSELKQVQAALRESEQRADLALEAAEMGTWDYDLVAHVCHFDARARQMYNLASASLDHSPENVASMVHTDDIGPMFDAIRHASDPGGDARYDVDYRIARGDGTYRWLRAWGRAKFEGEGQDRRAVRIIGASRDVTFEKEAEAALRESEAHLAAELKHTALLGDAAARLVTEDSALAIYEEILSAAMAITESDAGTVQVYDPGKSSLSLLVTRGIPREMADHFHEVDASSTTACGIALRTGKRTFVDFDQHADDEDCIMHVAADLRSGQATPLLSRDGSPIAMLNTHWRDSVHRPSEDQLRFLDLLARQAADMIERRRAEEALRDSEQRANLLLAELQHRVRNTLAVVRSIAQRTADKSTSLDDMLGHFQGRLDAFSRVQAALTRNANALIDIATLIEDELAAHGARDAEQIDIKGPEVLLASRTAEQLGLAIHELVTNAVKHGALNRDKGKLQISWRKEQLNGSEDLLLSWIESGVQLAGNAPSRKGFGMEMILRSLPYNIGGTTSVELTPDGLRFDLRMPLLKSTA